MRFERYCLKEVWIAYERYDGDGIEVLLLADVLPLKRRHKVFIFSFHFVLTPLAMISLHR